MLTFPVGFTLISMRNEKENPVKAYLSRIGRKGGQAVVKKYGKRQLREWGKLGGRPRKKKPKE